MASGKGWYGEPVAEAIKGLRACHGLVLYPGRYNFYYLPRSKLVLSAEELEPKDVMLQRHRDELLGALQLTHEDLEANRRGQLTRRQADSWRTDVWVTVLFALLLASLAGAAWFFSGHPSATLIFGLWAAIIGYRSLISSRRHRVLAFRGQLLSKDIGPEERSHLCFSGHGIQKLFQLEWSINERVTTLVIVGANYAVYYTGGKVAVAVEPVE
ncbi:MAG TPA: hypothetical protein VFQ61_27160 [Polyangiaceae bacterium]|nr:hypothetical protein [Polyangiaceae bacterium]